MEQVYAYVAIACGMIIGLGALAACLGKIGRAHV